MSELGQYRKCNDIQRDCLKHNIQTIMAAGCTNPWLQSLSYILSSILLSFANGVFIRHICCVQSFYILQWRKWCKRVQRYQRRDLWLITVCDLIICFELNCNQITILEQMFCCKTEPACARRQQLIATRLILGSYLAYWRGEKYLCKKVFFTKVFNVGEILCLQAHKVMVVVNLIRKHFPFLLLRPSYHICPNEQ